MTPQEERALAAIDKADASIAAVGADCTALANELRAAILAAGSLEAIEDLTRDLGPDRIAEEIVGALAHAGLRDVLRRVGVSDGILDVPDFGSRLRARVARGGLRSTRPRAGTGA